jgi:cell division protein ZapA
MPQIDVTIHGRRYPVVCEPGQEARVNALAGKVDGIVRQIAASGGLANEAQLLVLASLVLADEASEQAEGAAVENGAAENAAAEAAVPPALLSALDRVAARLESIAARVANP